MYNRCIIKPTTFTEFKFRYQREVNKNQDLKKHYIMYSLRLDNSTLYSYKTCIITLVAFIIVYKVPQLTLLGLRE